MKVYERKQIERQVQHFIGAMPSGYEVHVPKEAIVSEILKANDWFREIRAPLERIRKEIEHQYTRQQGGTSIC